MTEKEQPIDEKKLAEDIKRFMKENLITRVVDNGEGGFYIETLWKGEILDDS